MENPIKMDVLGGNTPIFGNTHMNQVVRDSKKNIFLFFDNFAYSAINKNLRQFRKSSLS